MSLSRITRIVLILAVTVMGIGVAVPAAAQGDNTLIMARAVDATGLDPHTQTAFASLRLLELIYEPLILADENLNLVPALAESWAFSEDGLHLTLNLRQGVTFHDGSDFTAEDVIASLERILDEETGSATRTNLLSIESIEAPDDYTVVLNLTLPDVPLVAALSSINTAILPSEVIANGDPAADVVGTGPFMLESWQPEEKTVLKANPNYWGEGPFVDGIEIRIIPDEARTFGMEALFRQVGIYSHVGPLYEPVDSESLLYYKEAKDGQILEEGINEAGALASFIAAGTPRATHGTTPEAWRRAQVV